MDIVQYLARRQISFEAIEHQPTYTALEMAQSIHVKGRQVAKAVLLRTRDGYLIAILPSAHRIDMEALEALVGVRPIQLATEAEIAALFPDVESGVVSPFGSEYGIRTVLDIHLAGCETIVFVGRSHTESIRLQYEDFERLENPIKGRFASPVTS